MTNNGEKYFSAYKFSQPISLKEGLKRIISDSKLKNEGISMQNVNSVSSSQEILKLLNENDIIKRVRETLDYVNNKKKRFKGIKLLGIEGISPCTTVYDIGENKVLKVSRENPFEYRKHQPEFDIPLYSGIDKYKNSYVYIQAKANTQDVTLDDVKNVQLKMKKLGYEPSNDFYPDNVDQIGIYNGNTYLIDSRCAIKSPNNFSRFIHKIVNFYKKLNGIETFYDLNGHVNEKPIKNYTWKNFFSL